MVTMPPDAQAVPLLTPLRVVRLSAVSTL
ncbi:hypothetical protein GQ600_14590 [Phytophthora cactorum]|nr:hypothetical protein GQ600_14590 [Phytophthora cactorum]